MTGYTKHRFHTLDGMRGIAAIVVLVFHARHGNFRCFINSYLAVDFFFVLSGFVIFHSYADKIMRGMTFQEYVARRIGRLYPLMVVGVLLGAPVLYLKITTDLSDYTRRDFAETMLTNLFMLPYITAKEAAYGIFPTDPPLWSIAFEMLANLSFPLLLQLDKKRLITFCLAWLIVIMVSSLVRGLIIDHRMHFDINSGFTLENILGGFPRVFFGFACGMLLYRWFGNSRDQTRSINPWLLYVELVAMLLVPVFARGLYAVFFIAVLSPLTVWLGAFSVCRDRFTLRLSEFLGWLSYPLYCLHRPVLDAVKYLDPKDEWSIRFGVPEQIFEIGLSLIVAVLSGYVVQRLELQRRITNFLRPAAARTETASNFPKSPLCPGILLDIDAMTDKPADNPHMWIPYHGPEPYDEVCHLCGVFSGAHHNQPDPPAAQLPCPEQWPASNFTAEDFAGVEAEAEAQDRADGKSALYDRR